MTITTTADGATAGAPAKPAGRPAGRIDLDGLAGLRTVRARHPWRWAAGAVALVVLAQFGPTFADVETIGVLGAVGAAVLGLGLHQAAFAAEIIRGGIIAVDAGQREAATALGVPRWRQAMGPSCPMAGKEGGSCCRRRCAASCRPPPTR